MLTFGDDIETTVEMRGSPDPRLAMLTTLSTEEMMPAGHPLTDPRDPCCGRRVLAEIDPVLDRNSAAGSRCSVPPEASFRATVLAAMYSIRSFIAGVLRTTEIRRCLLKWFLDVHIDNKPAFDASTCSTKEEGSDQAT